MLGAAGGSLCAPAPAAAAPLRWAAPRAAGAGGAAGAAHRTAAAALVLHPTTSSSARRRRGGAARATAAAAAAAASSPLELPVRAVLFDMDGVLCDSEIVSRAAAAEVFAELYGVRPDPAEFAAFTGMGEAHFLGGVAAARGVAAFEVGAAKAAFFRVYLEKYAVPGAGIGYPGARALVEGCRAAGLRVAVASSADRVKVDANLAAADIPISLFDAVVSADAFERLKPHPDIFLAAAAELGVPPAACVVIEDAVAGVAAARAAGMRVVGLTTTLAPAAMASARPDRTEAAIAALAPSDLVALRLRPGALEGAAVRA